MTVRILDVGDFLVYSTGGSTFQIRNITRTSNNIIIEQINLTRILTNNTNNTNNITVYDVKKNLFKSNKIFNEVEYYLNIIYFDKIKKDIKLGKKIMINNKEINIGSFYICMLIDTIFFNVKIKEHINKEDIKEYSKKIKKILYEFYN